MTGNLKADMEFLLNDPDDEPAPKSRMCCGIWVTAGVTLFGLLLMAALVLMVGLGSNGESPLFGNATHTSNLKPPSPDSL
eukprot:807219-Pyramimonas_sp.AAC.1